jgi:hypothetical protein
MRWLWTVLALAALTGYARAEEPRAEGPVRLWHAYTGQEEQALREAVARYKVTHPAIRVELLAIPFGSYASKLESAIAVGRGPDLFIDAHERLPQYFERVTLPSTLPKRSSPRCPGKGRSMACRFRSNRPCCSSTPPSCRIRAKSRRSKI